MPIDQLKPSFLDGFLFDGVDKIVHISLFILMSFFYQQAFNFKVYKIFFHLFFIGLTIEILQKELNLGRSFECLDIFADILGVIIFAMAYYWWGKTKKVL